MHAIEPHVPLLEYQPGLPGAELADVEAVLGWRFPAGVAERLPRLRWVCSVGAGVEKLLVPQLLPQVCVSRIVDAEQADGIAQFVGLGALRHARDGPLYESEQRRGAVDPPADRRAGQAMSACWVWARWAARWRDAAGGGLPGHRRQPPFGAVAAVGAGGQRRPRLCAAADVADQGLLNAQALALMPRGST